MVFIVTRSGKGSDLTPDEVDGNFVRLGEAIEAAVGGIFVDGFTQDPVTKDLSITFSDGTIIGPIVLPVRFANPRGNWVTATPYAEGDAVRFDGALYVATADHISGVFADDLAAGKQSLYVKDGELQPAPDDGKAYLQLGAEWSEADAETVAYAGDDPAVTTVKLALDDLYAKVAALTP